MAEQTNEAPDHHVEIWIDGEPQLPGQARVSVLDRGFLYGDSIFETMRTYRGKCFALEDHLERLAKSAERVFIELPISLHDLSQEVVTAVEQSSFSECYVRVMVTRGIGALGLDPHQAVRPLRVVILAPLVAPSLELYSKGIEVVTFESLRMNDATSAAGAKIGNYLIAVLAARQAAKVGAKESLITNAKGDIAEGSTSNVFWFEGETLWTPPLEAGILPGITRAYLLEAARGLGLEVGMRVVTKAELLASSGVFISSSIREVLSVVRIDGEPVGDARVSPAVLRLHAEFRRRAGVAPIAVPEVQEEELQPE